MPDIKFERFERDCGHNRHSGRKINDFRVIIDGEFRALLKRNMYGRGYYLTDPDQRAIDRPNHKIHRSFPINIPSQAMFKMGILAVLTEGLIPDAQTLEEIRASEVAKQRQEALEEDARRRQGRMQESADKMYAMLRRLQKSKPAGVEIAGLDDLIHYIDYSKRSPHDPELD